MRLVWGASRIDVGVAAAAQGLLGVGRLPGHDRAGAGVSCGSGCGGWSGGLHHRAGSPFGFVLAGIGRTDDRQLAGYRAIAGPLLESVGEFVGEQPAAGLGPGLIAVGRENHVPSHRVSQGIHRPRRFRRGRIRVDANGAKIAAEAGLEESSRARVESPARGAQDLGDGGWGMGRGRRGCRHAVQAARLLLLLAALGIAVAVRSAAAFALALHAEHRSVGGRFHLCCL